MACMSFKEFNRTYQGGCSYPIVAPPTFIKGGEIILYHLIGYTTLSVCQNS